MPFHVIAPGESLSKVAQKYGLDSWRKIYDHPRNAEFRRLRPDPDRIFPGDRLFVPGGGPEVPDGRRPCAGVSGLVHAPAFQVGQEPRSGDCGFFAGYVAHLVDRHSIRGAGSITMTAADVYEARNGFYPHLGERFGPGPSDLGYPGLYEPEMLSFLRHLGTHSYVSESSLDYRRASDLVTERVPGGDRDVTLVAIRSNVAGHWIVLLATCVRNGASHFIFYDPAIRSSPKLRMLTEREVRDRFGVTKSGVYRPTPVKRPSSGAVPF